MLMIMFLVSLLSAYVPFAAQFYFQFEIYAELLSNSLASRDDQRNHVGRAGAAQIDKEVGMALRDLCLAMCHALQYRPARSGVRHNRRADF